MGDSVREDLLSLPSPVWPILRKMLLLCQWPQHTVLRHETKRPTFPRLNYSMLMLYVHSAVSHYQSVIKKLSFKQISKG